MKKSAIFALAAILVVSLCACTMGNGEPATTPPATEAPTTAPSVPPATDPTESEPIIDPTLDTNIPDPSVDDDHLIDPTDDGTVLP